MQPQRALVLLEAGTISDGKAVLKTSGPAVLLTQRADGKWEGWCDGPAKKIVFSGMTVRDVRLDGRPQAWEATPEGISLTLPAGRHYLTISP